MMNSALSPAILFAVATGGALGAVLRYLVSVKGASLMIGQMPLGMLLVNAAGSLLIGVVVGLLQSRAIDSELWRPLLVVGLLGGLTTFSTFSLEALTLISRDQWLAAMLYVTTSVVGCIALTALGFKMAS